MDAWFAKAKKLQTGQRKTTCVSCHLTVPYVLSRSALRQAMHVSSATPQEVRLIEEATWRVETYDAHEPLYASNEKKTAESRGTEAVLNALILAKADAEQKRQDASESTRKALRRLWETQRSDGAWDWLDAGLEPFESVDAAYYGAALAALAIGTAPALSTSQSTDATVGIDKLRGYLKEKYPAQSLFNRAWVLLASTRLKDLLTGEQREALIKEIESRQRDDGGWSLETLGPWRWDKPAAPFRAPGTLDASLLAKSDGYATGLIVYTLREAGLPVDHPAVRKGLRWLRANQQDVQVGQQMRPAWRTHSLNFDREHGGDKGEPVRRMFMSDSATAFAALALAGSD
jgi:squalene-hopene/tetraprenyl-beta-curcumene cyclase